MKILAISGSLRAASSNTRLLRAAIALAPEGVDVALFERLGELPHFNPDEEERAPDVLREFQARLREAEALLISTPEYAHGVPGVLKNALDWVVGSGELMAKPVALINAAPHATHAQASLIETLTVMSAVVIPEACVAIAMAGKSVDHPDVVAALRTSLAALVSRASDPRPA